VPADDKFLDFTAVCDVARRPATREVSTFELAGSMVARVGDMSV
jgi:hypothetical protein